MLQTKTYRKGSLFDSVRMLIEVHVPQHHQRGQQESRWVGQALA